MSKQTNNFLRLRPRRHEHDTSRVTVYVEIQSVKMDIAHQLKDDLEHAGWGTPRTERVKDGMVTFQYYLEV